MSGTEGRERVLKADLLGRVLLVDSSPGRGPGPHVRREPGAARWWLRPLARHLARREARALARLEGIPGVPRLLATGPGGVVVREWLEGRPMHHARPADPAWYRAALGLLVALHRRGVAHDDLAKEPNWLVLADGRPGLVDFQLALVSRRRSRLFRLLAREDLRHLLKHKRSYCPEGLTPRELAILASPSLPARLWRATGKRAYLLVTRRLLGWADREGAGDRGAPGQPPGG